MSEKVCLDCGVGMEIGYVPDFAPGGWMRSGWYPGAAREMTFFGMRVGRKRWIEVPTTGWIPVTGYRCPECGVLKFYAEKGE
ncbi:hypothetical protein [Lacunimicrobium album]